MTYHKTIERHTVATEGVVRFCEDKGAFWLLDAIASWQPKARKDAMLREIQFWRLEVTNGQARLVCARDKGDDAFEQTIPFTDFPDDSARVWVERGGTGPGGDELWVVLLPEEH
jgi:hypothetical protein